MRGDEPGIAEIKNGTNHDLFFTLNFPMTNSIKLEHKWSDRDSVTRKNRQMSIKVAQK